MYKPKKLDIICLNCKKKFSTSNSLTKYCSYDCKNIYHRANDDTGGMRKLLSSGTIGAISELIISNDLLRRGYAVFRSLSPSCYCDLIAVKNNKKYEIEVRTAFESHNNILNFPKKANGKNVIFAVYVRNRDKIRYLGQNLRELSL